MNANTQAAATQAAAGRPHTVLVLQGGGALGAYQAGVYEALHEHGLTPDWVVGTSIGAINAALIAGNPHALRVPRLREFWDTVAHEDLFDMRRVPDAMRRFNTSAVTMDSVLFGVPGFYVPRWFSPFLAGWPVPAEQASFYDTSPLERTLSRLIDLGCMNDPGRMRLTVNAIRVRSGELEAFDTAHRAVGIRHVLASGALPPAFAPVRIDGELYWDGGLYSNTPLENVLADPAQVDTVCFMVDLWSGHGPEPLTADQVETRRKDVLYASRSERHIEAYLRGHKLRRMIRMLREKVPPDRLSPEERRELDEVGRDTTIHIVRLAYTGRDWQMPSKDVNFSRGSVGWRWDRGYRDTLRAIEHGGWRRATPEGAGLLVHEAGPPDMWRQRTRQPANA